MLFGCPGAGKGTQRELLKRHFELRGIPCQTIDVGRYLRGITKRYQDAKIIGSLSQMMERGDPVPAAFPVSALIKATLKIKNEECGCIITDGIGRRLHEVEIAIELLLEIPQSQINAVVLDISQDEVKNRLICRGRMDDQDHAIDKRINLYESKEGTQAAIRYLCEHPSVRVHRVSGTEKPKIVFGSILKCLNI